MILHVCVDKSANAFVTNSQVTTTRPITARMASGDADDMLQTASRLRKEAEELEQSVRGKGTGDVSIKKSTAKESIPVKSYTSLQDSSWTISYRFASDAVSKDDDADVKVTYYSGKVKIQLTDDGYTNILNEDDSPPSSSGLTFNKFWGWDEETSNEDDLQYVLFSADVLLPKSDPNYEKKPTRFYFQAKVDTDSSRSGEISCSDGTVTLKKDVEPPGGFWGVFNGGGILAQFRYCGEFLMKPC